LLEVLANYGIKIYQIYSIQTDNGSNMLNEVKRLIDEAIEGKRDKQSENDHESGIISCAQVPSPSISFQPHCILYELYLHDFGLEFDENEDEVIEGDDIEDEPDSNEPFF